MPVKITTGDTRSMHDQPSSNPNCALSSRLSIPLAKPQSCHICCDTRHFAVRCPLLANLHFAYLTTPCSAVNQTLTALPNQETRIIYRIVEINIFTVADIQAPPPPDNGPASFTRSKTMVQSKKNKKKRILQLVPSIIFLAHYFCSMHSQPRQPLAILRIAPL